MVWYGIILLLLARLCTLLNSRIIIKIMVRVVSVTGTPTGFSDAKSSIIAAFIKLNNPIRTVSLIEHCNKRSCNFALIFSSTCLSMTKHCSSVSYSIACLFPTNHNPSHFERQGAEIFLINTKDIEANIHE